MVATPIVHRKPQRGLKTPMTNPLSELTPDYFEPHAGENFTLGAKGASLELKLVEIKRLGTALRKGGAFSLLFTTAPGPFLPQAIYPITHPKLGALDLFIVPLGPKKGANQYEAVFT